MYILCTYNTQYLPYLPPGEQCIQKRAVRLYFRNSRLTIYVVNCGKYSCCLEKVSIKRKICWNPFTFIVLPLEPKK